MDFGLNEDQETLAKYARDFLTNECPTTFVRKMLDDSTAYDAGFYKHMAELGWMGIAIPEEFGGQGMTYVDLAVLLEEMGRALVPGPFFASVCLAAPVLVEAGDGGDILRGIASGERNATVAHAGEVSVSDGKASGSVRFVLDAHVADAIVVCDGKNLYAVDTSSGVNVTQLKAMDMTRRLCDVTFDGATATPLGGGKAALERGLQKATGMLCAECVGGSAQVLDLSVAYARERVQFGRPIGSFQAVKHKCADMLVDVEMGRSAMYFAAWTASEDDPELPLAASIAKAFCGDAYTRVASNGIHVHGGIGFTWEHDMHLFFKRAKANEVFLGDPTHHRDLVAKLVAA